MGESLMESTNDNVRNGAFAESQFERDRGSTANVNHNHSHADNDNKMALKRLVSTTNSCNNGTKDSTRQVLSSPSPFHQPAHGNSFDSSSNVITQPSPPEEEEETKPTFGSCHNNSMNSSSSKMGMATPSRRSKRVRTPSAKKKASIESERLLSSNRTKKSISLLLTNHNTTEVAPIPPPIMLPVNPSSLTIAIAVLKPMTSTTTLQNTTTAIPLPKSRAISVSTNTPHSKSLGATTTNTTTTTSSYKPKSCVTTRFVHNKPKLPDAIDAPSPSAELLNADLLNTPPSTTDKDNNDYDGDLSWILNDDNDNNTDAESTSPKPTYFADSPKALHGCTTPPPPKRNTRIRTPFAKAFASTSPLNYDEDATTTTMSTKSSIRSKSFGISIRKTNPTHHESSNNKMPPVYTHPSPIVVTTKANNSSNAVSNTTNIGTIDATQGLPVDLEPSTANKSNPFTATPTGTGTPASNNQESSQPLKRKSHSDDQTPGCRSSRRTSLLPLSPSQSSNVTPRSPSRLSKLKATPRKPFTTDNGSEVVGLDANANVGANTSQDTLASTGLDTIDKINIQPFANAMSTRHNYFDSPLAAVPEKPNLQVGQNNITSTPTIKTTIELAPETTENTRKRRSARRASIAGMGSLHTESPATDSESSVVTGSIFVDDDTPPLKKRRNSRRASLLVGQSPHKPSEQAESRNESQTTLSSKSGVSSLPPAGANMSNQSSTASTSAISNKMTTKSKFCLPPLPTPAVPQRRSSRRASMSASKAICKDYTPTTAMSNNKNNSILDATPPSTATSRRSRRLSIVSTIPPQPSSVGIDKSTSAQLAAIVNSKAAMRPSPLAIPKYSLTKQSPLEMSQPSETSDTSKLCPSTATTPLPGEEVNPTVLSDEPLALQPSPSYLMLGNPASVPRQVLREQDMNIQEDNLTTIDYTPTLPRRSTRRKSTSASKSLSVSTQKVPSSISRVQCSVTKRRLLSSTEKHARPTAELSPLREEDKHLLSGIHASMIATKASQMFSNSKIRDEACASARIFACYELAQRQSDCNSVDEDLSIGVKPLMPLLESLVHVEMTSLSEESDQASNRPEKRRVHFSGFDCSSTKPPVDAKVGSHSHQQDCISAMSGAVNQMRVFIDRSGSDGEDGHRSLTSLVQFLQDLSINPQLLTECAKSIWADYPPKRLRKAIHLYNKDFECILHRHSTNRNSPLSSESTTHLERRLAEFVGQAVRFHFRRLFNPPPLPYTRPPDDSDDGRSFQSPSILSDSSNSRSGVHEIITLQLSVISRDSAVADASVSSLFSMALSLIYDYFGAEVFLKARNREDPTTLPDVFCSSPVSQRGLGTSKAPIKNMSSEELEEVLGDIDAAYNFLTVYKACQFVLELMSVPGVESEVEKMGGFLLVEHYAKVLQENDLATLCVEDAHFSVIGYAGTMGRVFATVKELLSHMESKVAHAEMSIAQLAKRYKTRVTSPKQRKAIFQKFPHVRVIASAMEDGKARYASFPKVLPVFDSP